MSNREVAATIQFVKCPFCDRVIPDLDGLKFQELVNHAPNWEGQTPAYSFAMSYIKKFKKATKEEMKKSDKIWDQTH
jgi:hypothetical protein